MDSLYYILFSLKRKNPKMQIIKTIHIPYKRTLSFDKRDRIQYDILEGPLR